MNIHDLDWIYNQFRYATVEDAELWHRLMSIGSNVDRSAKLPCGSGPHCIKAFRLFKTTHNPKKLVEIGFNTGTSAKILLTLGLEQMCSVEIRDTPQVDADAAEIKQLFPHFRLFKGSSTAFKPMEGESFDSAYVDGDHSLAGIVKDITICKRLGVKNILFDDLFPIHGDTLEALKMSGLTVDWICGNMAACSNIDRSTLLQF